MLGPSSSASVTASRYGDGRRATKITGGIAGAVLASAMFELPVVTWSTTVRAGGAQLLSEGVATFGLLGVVIAVGRTRAAIRSPLLIHAIYRTHPARPVQVR